MRSIKGIAFSFMLPIGILLTAPSFASEDALLLEELRESLAGTISTEMSGRIHSDLGKTGLSDADIERIAADLERKIAACFTESLLEYADLHQTPLADLIVDVDGQSGIEFEGDEAVDFQEFLEPCLIAAHAEAGIAME